MSAAPPLGTSRRVAPGVRAAVAGVWVTLAAAIGYVLAFDPTDRAADSTRQCAWHTLFGVNGPTCGGTRMVWYLLHGDLVQTGRHHLLALVGVPFALREDDEANTATAASASS